jgi:hypothetical protein
MKKLLLYIAMFLTGILIGSFMFEGYGDIKTSTTKSTESYLAINSPAEERPTDYIQSAMGMLGKTLIVNGVIKEAYKNKNNEVVIYLKDKTIPLMLNCSLYNSNIQIKRPIRLGESISIKGKFVEIDDEMHLENCKIIYRSKN